MIALIEQVAKEKKQGRLEDKLQTETTSEVRVRVRVRVSRDTQCGRCVPLTSAIYFTLVFLHRNCCARFPLWGWVMLIVLQMWLRWSVTNRHRNFAALWTSLALCGYSSWLWVARVAVLFEVRRNAVFKRRLGRLLCDGLMTPLHALFVEHAAQQHLKKAHVTLVRPRTMKAASFR
eukprot:4118246-Amphidinium_carterae.1